MSRTGGRRFSIPAFWQGMLVIAAAYLLFDNAFPPVMPRALLIQFMVITVVGVLLYYSSDDRRWLEFKRPVIAVLREPGLRAVRWLLLIAAPALAAWGSHSVLSPALEAPVELRQVHPAPPSTLRAFDKRFDLATLENPVREAILRQFPQDEDAAWASYRAAVAAGREAYYGNCFYCHGDQLDGAGPFGDAFSPPPANFRDIGTIAQLQEAFLFWRIATGGPGLPREGAPWNSAMPVWHELLSEHDIWNLIVFLYDDVGQVPRMWDQQTSRAVTAMKERVERERKALEGVELYRLRCAHCHGEQGGGDGPAAGFVYPRPRDFTLGLYKYKTSPGTQPARNEDLLRTIRDGLAGTAMPGWRGLLSERQIESLVPVLKRFDITATWAPENAGDGDFDEDGRYVRGELVSVTDTESTPQQLAYSPDSVARGREVFARACNECHGDEGRGNVISGKRLEDDWGWRIWPRDLSKPWTWRATQAVGKDDAARDATVRNIYQRLSIGIPGTPMPAHRAEEAGNEDPLSLEERWDVANFVYSLRVGAAPAPGESTVIRAARAPGEWPVSADDPLWQQAPPSTLRLAPNIIRGERLFTPLADALTVRVLYDEARIGFLLELNDRTDSRPGEPVSVQIQDDSLDLRADALAIQFPREGAWTVAPVVEKPLFRHGDARHPTHIWYWNAGDAEPPRPPGVRVLDARGPDEPLTARADPGGVSASGGWQHGRLRVMFERSRAEAPEGDLVFDEGRFIPVSFANWDGSNGEVGSRHTLTGWYWLVLPQARGLAGTWGISAAVFVGVFATGLVLVRAARTGAG